MRESWNGLFDVLKRGMDAWRGVVVAMRKSV